MYVFCLLKFLCTTVFIWKLLQIKSLYKLEITVLMTVPIYPNKTTSRSGAMILVTTLSNLQFSAILHPSYCRVKWECGRNFHHKSFKIFIVVLISMSLPKDTNIFVTLLLEVWRSRTFTWLLYQNSPY